MALAPQPGQEKRVVAGLFNRYCIRCHGVDGRGVWDIPDVPDFTNVRWQALRSDAQRGTIIIEGRGAVMPPFRGALTLEEAWRSAATCTRSCRARRFRAGSESTDFPRRAGAASPGTKKPEQPAK